MLREGETMRPHLYFCKYDQEWSVLDSSGNALSDLAAIDTPGLESLGRQALLLNTLLYSGPASPVCPGRVPAVDQPFRPFSN